MGVRGEGGGGGALDVGGGVGEGGAEGGAERGGGTRVPRVGFGVPPKPRRGE